MSYRRIIAFVAPGEVKPEEPSRESVLRWFTVFGPKKRANLENYLELTRDFGLGQEEASIRMGVSVRTLWRYEADIRAAMEATK